MGGTKKGWYVNEREVRALRARLGMTQKGLAEASGLSLSQVSRIERGNHDPHRSTSERLSAALDVDPARLIRRGNR